MVTAIDKKFQESARLVRIKLSQLAKIRLPILVVAIVYCITQ